MFILEAKMPKGDGTGPPRSSVDRSGRMKGS